MSNKITIVDEWPENGITPSLFYVRNALGQYVFINTRSRAKAQQIVDEEYGKGRWTVRVVSKAIIR